MSLLLISQSFKKMLIQKIKYILYYKTHSFEKLEAVLRIELKFQLGQRKTKLRLITNKNRIIPQVLRGGKVFFCQNHRVSVRTKNKQTLHKNCNLYIYCSFTFTDQRATSDRRIEGRKGIFSCVSHCIAYHITSA